ncbi:hypothetical protein [Paraburkholderia caribensis]|uniref:maleate cis-trans isomerase family protein n=1 Tax=Paraburkholderia caribensis TaxID=75105 RepID=UPI00078C6858|nr:hypothetical protein [Paraburkholderia caribensis]AMV48373.1 hypothetical protein ATN79_47845 [Paraburkholderia caribensis]
MPSILGWRRVFGIATPSVNTVVQLEFDDLRPAGVVNHCEGMFVPDMPTSASSRDEESLRLIDLALEDAVKRIATCRPDHIVLGVSAESIWGGGLSAARSIDERIRSIVGDIPVSQAADAFPKALETLGVTGKLGVIHPYGDKGDPKLRAYFDEAGYDVSRTQAVPVSSLTGIAHTELSTIFDAVRSVDGDDVAAIVQFGANLPFGRAAAAAELWLGKPVIAVNVATYWYALRREQITDRVDGYGHLFSHY